MKYRFLIITCLLLSLSSFLSQTASAVCTPQSAVIWVNGDDNSSVWINGNYLGGVNYVNWDSPSDPVSLNVPVAYLNATGDNVIAIAVTDTAGGQIWGSFALDVTCVGGMHSYVSSNDGDIKLSYTVNYNTPPAADWYSAAFDDTTWGNAVAMTVTTWAKPLYDPSDGKVVVPYSYDAVGASGANEWDLGPVNMLYMRKHFTLSPVTPLPSATIVISKSANQTSQIMGGPVTFTIQICNTGGYTRKPILITDYWVSPTECTWSMGGPYYWDDLNNGKLYRDAATPDRFTLYYPLGMEANVCKTFTYEMNPCWFSTDWASTAWCTTATNYSTVTWTTGSANTSLPFTLYCPSKTNTPSRTPTPSRTYTPTRTFTHTSTIASTATRTATGTYTRTITRTSTPTGTRTATLSPTGTPTRTPSSTPTRTPTVTLTRTATRTATPASTATFTVTRTSTGTATRTATVTHTRTATQASTATFTATRSTTGTATRTATLTFTRTISPTPSSSGSPTPTFTRTATRTVTRTATPSPTHTITSYDTATSTLTITQTYTRTPTFTHTVTRTATRTASATASMSQTPSNTRTWTPTPTHTITSYDTATSTRTITETYTRTPSFTYTVTRTPSPSSSATRTATPTPTHTITSYDTATSTRTITETYTQTPSFTPTATGTATPSVTFTPTHTITSYDTATFTLTVTETNTATPSYTHTVTSTPSPSSSATPTATITSYDTATSTLTVTETCTVTPTDTLTFTPTTTATSTGTATETSINTDTFTPTVTETSTATCTGTPTFSLTLTATETVSATDTPTVTYSPTPMGTPALLTITMSAVGDNPADASKIVYWIMLENRSSQPAYNIHVWDSLPAELAYLGMNNGAEPLVTGNEVSWDMPGTTLLPGESMYIQFTAGIVNFDGEGVIINSAWVDYNDSYYTPEAGKHPAIEASAIQYPEDIPVAYPNPFRISSAVNGELKFFNVPSGSVIQIYTISGEFVTSIDVKFVRAVWNGKNIAGREVSPGIYFYIIRNLYSSETIKGKIFIIK